MNAWIIIILSGLIVLFLHFLTSLLQFIFGSWGRPRSLKISTTRSRLVEEDVAGREFVPGGPVQVHWGEVREGMTSDWPVNRTWLMGSPSSPPLCLKYTLCSSGCHFQESSERGLSTEELMLLIVVLEKTLFRVPWTAKRANQQRNQPLIFTGRTDAEA